MDRGPQRVAPFSGAELMFRNQKIKPVNKSNCIRECGHSSLISRFRRLVSVLLLTIACGCAVTRGPQPVLSKDGLVNPNASDGLAAKFQQSADAAFISTGARSARIPKAPEYDKQKSESQAAQKMMSDGFALVYASCSDFFTSAGQTQKWLIVARDAVGAAGTLATSILALTHAGAAATAGTALGTGAFFSATDIYTKDFLFAAENIESVRTLTLNALTKHSSNVPVGDWLTYNDASVAILDSQDLCSVSRIAAMARDAIRNGKPDTPPDEGNATNVGGAKKTGDEVIVDALNNLLKPVSAANKAAQLGAVYWLMYGNPSTDAERASICQALALVPPERSPVEEKIDQGKAVCNIKSDWIYRQNAKALLDELSPTAISALKKSIDAFRQAQAIYKTQSADLAGGQAPIVEFALPSTPTPRPSTHVNIVIR
jgi:hypothetical protein